MILLAAPIVILVSTASVEAAEKSFTGRWKTSFGPMTLKQTANKVTGSYQMQNASGTIAGEIKGGKLHFTYREGTTTGEGWFQLAADGSSFTGRWRETGRTSWSAWVGKRVQQQTGFAGLWISSYGRMRLVETGGKIHGIYAYSAASTISGKREGDRFVFRYKEPKKSGEGWFKLSADGQSLIGKWKEDGASGWGNWTARRAKPTPGVSWLVVVEARWESSLNEREYAFGDMLKTFFDRTKTVQVRRRKFNDENDIRRWIREVAFLAEPVVLCIASHGTGEGVTVAGRTISPAVIADSLRYASNVKLLHFSACLMMKRNAADKIIAQLGPSATFPISGYATSVDWAASAVIEFMYFDLVLSRRMPVARAAKQILVLFPTAGEKRVPGAVLRPAGFRIKHPPAKTAAITKPAPKTTKPSSR